MKAKLFVATLCILAIPVLFSPGQHSDRTTSSFTVVEAGHTIGGLWCQCGAPACICDPGENANSVVIAPAPATRNKPAAPNSVATSTALFGLIVLLALLVRFRA